MSVSQPATAGVALLLVDSVERRRVPTLKHAAAEFALGTVSYAAAKMSAGYAGQGGAVGAQLLGAGVVGALGGMLMDRSSVMRNFSNVVIAGAVANAAAPGIEMIPGVSTVNSYFPSY